MRRAALALGCSFALATPTFAQIASPLELVRGLRQHGLVDLAVQRLEELKANPALISPEEAKLIPLELARIRLEEASRESEDSRRATLIGQAKASFDEFIRENPTHPMAAQANVEIARLLALQAKGQLSRGNRQEDKEARALEFSRARPDFTNAINRYKSAILNLDTRLKKLEENDPLAGELKRSKAQAELDAAVLQYEFGLTFIGEDELRNRSEAVDKAQKQFEALATTYANTRIGYQAQVWALQCGFINGDPKAVPAIEKFATANRPNRDAADAVRLAGYFGIEHAFAGEVGKDSTPGNQFQRAELAATHWLQTYPEAKNTPEGLGARFRRALMKEYQATRVPGMIQYEEPPKPKTKPKESEPEAPKGPRKIKSISQQAKSLLEEANKIYQELTETDNEYSERAHRHRLTNQLVILEGEGRGGDAPLKSVNTLEQAYLAAQVQQAKMFDLQKSDKPAADVEKEEKQRVKKAIEYLERGLQRIAPKDTPREVFDAQLLLTQFLTKDDRATEAAVLGEALARNNPKVSKASAAAVLGVYAYNTAIGRLKQAGGRDEDETVDLQRLKNLATFAINTWPNDGPTDAARHVLGFYLSNKDKDYETAWRTYAGIGNGYPAVAQARREMAGALFYLLRPEEKDPKKYRETLQQNLTSRAKQYQATIAALDALPPPPPSAPGPAVESWAGAKTMQAQLYYMAADYDKVDQTVKVVTDTVTKLPDPDEKHREALDPKRKQDLVYTIRALKYNALQGRAADFIRSKEFAKVGEVLGPEIEALKKELKEPAPEETPGYSRLRKARQDFVVVAMSGYLQNKQADQAGELLDALQSAGASVEQNVAALRSLVTSVRLQIDTLTKENKKAEADEMARGFAEFLDKIKGDDTGKLSNTVIVFLGDGYAAVDQAGKAAELFGQALKRPFTPSPKATPEELEEAKAKHAAFLREVEFREARAYRLAGKFAEATALMKKIVGDPVPAKKGEPVPRGWGYGNIGIRKEYCVLLEDQNFFGPAVQNWTQMTADFAQSRGGPPLPVKFLGSRPTFESYGKALDGNLAAHFGMAADVASFLDVGFKTVFPTVAETRNRQRLIYFDLYYEAMRCSARAYSTPSLIPKIKGGQATADQKLADIGQKFHELLTKNDDVPPDVREKITELINKHPRMKKKFDELTAATPAAKTN
jgi:outer membrane protein assembly factor BamD (BamD/ComL family)